MLLGDPRQADQRTQSFHFPIVIHQSLDPALNRWSAKLLVFLHALEHSTGSERVDALGLRAVEVIICMITRDFSVISIDVTGVSLSLSLSLSLCVCVSISLSLSTTHKSHSRRIIGSASALPIIRRRGDMCKSFDLIWLILLEERCEPYTRYHVFPTRHMYVGFSAPTALAGNLKHVAWC